MHYRDITSKALELGWLKTEGLTPEASMYAQILTKSSEEKNRGRSPASKSWAMEWLGLTIWKSTGLERHIDSFNDKQRKVLMER